MSTVDHADIVVITRAVVPEDVLATYGFSSDDRHSFLKFSDYCYTLIVRLVDGESKSLNSQGFRHLVNWLLSYGE